MHVVHRDLALVVLVEPAQPVLREAAVLHVAHVRHAVEIALPRRDRLPNLAPHVARKQAHQISVNVDVGAFRWQQLWVGGVVLSPRHRLAVSKVAHLCCDAVDAIQIDRLAGDVRNSKLAVGVDALDHACVKLHPPRDRVARVRGAHALAEQPAWHRHNANSLIRLDLGLERFQREERALWVIGAATDVAAHQQHCVHKVRALPELHVERRAQERADELAHARHTPTRVARRERLERGRHARKLRVAEWQQRVVRAGALFG
mmetsp:Transcript_20874/g.40593  ORF Transcript_20874/g.40593 Transcript_20874/m.40593 type:complete len:261 (-) Transcript_20874:1042-1824(-)|eukprot:1202984-Pleurochrysis_carterae.AAC.1